MCSRQGEPDNLLRAPWKGAGQQWVRVPPGNWIAPPGNNRSSGGSNEAAEAFGAEGLKETW